MFAIAFDLFEKSILVRFLSSSEKALTNRINLAVENSG